MLSDRPHKARLAVAPANGYDRPMRRAAPSSLLAGSLALVVSLAASGPWARAAAPRRPARADFEDAVLERAAERVPEEDCDGDPDAPRRARRPRALARAERVAMLGRVLTLPDGRALALVRTATERADANGDLAYGLFAVTLARGAAAWERSAVTEVALEDAPFHYDAPITRIARLEDLDDDGEAEVLLVLDTNTETACGTGYCTVRRTVVLDAGEAGVPVVANVESRRTCQADTLGRTEGTVLFEDRDGDGHRDLVARARVCGGAEPDEDGEWIVPPCDPPRESVRAWTAATDRYAAPR